MQTTCYRRVVCKRSRAARCRTSWQALKNAAAYSLSPLKREREEYLRRVSFVPAAAVPKLLLDFFPKKSRGPGAEPRPPEAALTLKGGARSDQRGALFPAPHPNRPQALSSAAHPPEQHDSAQFGNSQVSKLAERCGLAFQNVAALDISVTSLLLGEWHLTDKSRAVRLYASGCQRLISAAGAPATRQTGWAR